MSAGDESSEDDYMSAAFLVEDTAAVDKARSKDGRWRNKRKREADERAEKSERAPKTKVARREAIKEGLTKAVSEDNVGFKLMAKMGYEKGKGLGNGEGIKEPVPLHLRPARAGLGVVAEKKEKEARAVEQQKKVETTNVMSFMQRKSLEFKTRKIRGQLRDATATLVALDRETGRASVWVEEADAKEKKEQEESDTAARAALEGVVVAPLSAPPPEPTLEEMSDKLALALTDLRSVHSYCLYCGVTYKSAGELVLECPGPSEDDHE